MNFYALVDNPFFILLVILVVFGGIALLVFFLRKYLPGFKEPEEKVSEEEAVKEELDRVLVSVEDEEAKKQLEQFNQDGEDKE